MLSEEAGPDLLCNSQGHTVISNPAPTQGTQGPCRHHLQEVRGAGEVGLSLKEWGLALGASLTPNSHSSLAVHAYGPCNFEKVGRLSAPLSFPFPFQLFRGAWCASCCQELSQASDTPELTMPPENMAWTMGEGTYSLMTVVQMTVLPCPAVLGHKIRWSQSNGQQGQMQSRDRALTGQGWAGPGARLPRSPGLLSQAP